MASVALVALDKFIESPTYRMIEDQARLMLGPLKGYAPDLNSFVTSSLAAHAYDYLGLLWLFTGLTILGALVPLYKYIPEEELLYPDYDFEEPKKAPAPAPAPAGMGMSMGDMMKAPGDMMKAPGDMMQGGVSSGAPPAGGADGVGEDYSFYDYQYQYDGQSYDYFNYGPAKRKDSKGYPHPHHLWQHAVGSEPLQGHEHTRRA